MKTRTILTFAGLALLAACASSPRLDDQTRADFDRIWKLYRTNDPAWPEERTRWLQRSEAERSVLIENLLVDMLQTKAIADARQAPPWERPQIELAAIGDEVIPYVMNTMSLRATDAIALDRCVELLDRMNAAEPVRTAYEASCASPQAQDPREENYREALVNAAASMRAESAEAIVAAALVSDPSWKVRAGAATAIGSQAKPSTLLQDALIKALADPDWFVAMKAAEACGKLALERSVAQLVDLLERATNATQPRARDAALRSLRTITGRSDLSSAPAEWRALLPDQRKRS